ncbi:hypothetical protein BDZ91DRAFT_722654 [Kalaharituber pfeilii]|nr:hypothetical protein BDZ91DRAFT_722654 [Kalaharituber pfeilii]
MEYQSAPPSQGKLSRATSAVSGDGDGDGEYSSIPPPPKEIEYPSDVGSREREGKELEYHPRNPPPPISRAPSVKEVREIEYHPHGHPPPIPPPPALLPAGQKDNDYYDTTSEHPGIREIEYRPDTSYSHAKSRSRVGSELGPGGGQLYRPEAQQEPALVVRPPDPALITTPHWPPPREEAELDPRDAADLISNGTPLFRGKLREIVGAPRGYYSFYVCAGNEWDEETDCAPFQEATFGDMSSATTQGEALERPAMCHAFGRYPGSITLSCYTAGFSSQWRGVNDTTGAELSLKSTGGSRVKVRKLSMIHVVDRLRTLQDRGIEENDPVSLHDHIYNFLLYEPPRPGEGYSLETQISDLISALLRPSWIDFSVPENQVVSHFLRSTEPGVQNGFFHQLLLALELYLRIKISKLQKAIAAKVSWDLVLAQRWLENVEIQAPKVAKEGSSSVSFGFKNKESQREALKEFAWTLKWPNMHEVSYALSEEDDPAKVLEDRTVNCMSWFTGLILPGRSMPYIIMNALTDCDIDTPPNFRDIPSTAPNVGFQYRGHTYWHWECIVGKVLGAAKGVNQICGWLGPCISSPDLDRAEIAYINQIKPTNIIKLTAADVRNMQAASDPLGPESKTAYLTMDYDLIIPDREVVTDTIRIERLNFVPAKPVSEDELTVAGVAVPDSPMAASVVPSQSSVMQPPVPGGTASIGLGLSNVGLGSLSNGQKTTGPQPLPPPPPRPAQQPQRPIQTFDASITFAIRHRSWKVNLRYDTPFIAAYPCTGGPHVLYNKYYYHAVKVDSLVEIENWGPKAISAAAAAARRAKRIAREGGKRRRRRHGKRSRSCSERSGYRHHRHDSETESSVSDSASEDEDYDDHSDDEGESIARSDGSLDDRDHDYDDEDDDYDTLDSPPTPSSSFSPGKDDHLKLNNTLDEVLVVEAFGVHDNEVFARAWCSFWGRTCLACCVREAYAVGVSVVVLVDSGVGRRDDEVEEVDRKMEGL